VKAAGFARVLLKPYAYPDFSAPLSEFFRRPPPPVIAVYASFVDVILTMSRSACFDRKLDVLHGVRTTRSREVKQHLRSRPIANHDVAALILRRIVSDAGISQIIPDLRIPRNGREQPVPLFGRELNDNVGHFHARAVHSAAGTYTLAAAFSSSRARQGVDSARTSDILELGEAEKSRGGYPMPTRTTHRSKSGKKLYAVRDKQGRFKDIQTYKRAHGQDIKRKSKEEK
jgi:hypothetical protein